MSYSNALLKVKRLEEKYPHYLPKALNNDDTTMTQHIGLDFQTYGSINDAATQEQEPTKVIEEEESDDGYLDDQKDPLTDSEVDHQHKFVALLRKVFAKKKAVDPLSVLDVDSDEEENGIEYHRIKYQSEMGLLAEQFLGPIGKFFFYVVISAYLFGDLAIYAVSVPLSLKNVTGAIPNLTEMQTYQIYVGIFAVLVVPICFLNFSKTKYLQIATLFLRNVSLGMMIVISIIYIAEGHGTSFDSLTLFNFSGMKNLYGVVIYSFMCHHSLPGIVTPIRRKNWLNVLFSLDFVCILMTYVLLCVVAMFAFGDPHLQAHCQSKIGAGEPCFIQELYTTNFISYDVVPIGVFLNLFPVFTLTTNYPLIAITLRNNLVTLFSPIPLVKKYPRLTSFCMSAIASIPPIIVAVITTHVTDLAGYTGGFAGMFIEFVFPALIVYFARKELKEHRYLKFVNLSYHES
eukprot:CAMPEP_0117425434 /NCGR_PEP_ID=MMETSP0758-20121206/5692_1 /TAXON_ID=63605 /ORGANISM="Percolomonas cosmopolitus, Strain AE-1 (ATCC 50343)" /LENGTH=458 /DNA_ID=CAMNT_0005209887 /DNA_START=163 /DNA_END=1536 /DNA_ORIENTATION=+